MDNVVEALRKVRIPLDQALVQVQWALIKLQSQPGYADLDIELKTVDLDLVTYTDFSVEGEATVYVVTVAGDIAVKSTNTLKIALRPPAPRTEDEAALDIETVGETIERLGEAMFSIVAQARDGFPPLELKEGGVAVELVVDGGGSVKVATPGAWGKILKLFGFDASVKAASRATRTSTITLTFKNAGDVEDEA